MLKHAFTCPVANDSDPNTVGSTEWNADHIVDTDGITMATATTHPATPAANNIVLYGENIGGKQVLNVLDEYGYDVVIQEALWENDITMWFNTTATAGLWVNTTGGTTNGTYAKVLPTTTNNYTAVPRSTYANVVTTTNQVLGQRNIEKMWYVSNAANTGGGFHFTARFGFDVWTNGGRLFVGLSAGTNTTTACPVIAADPSTVANGVGFCIDAADNGAISFLTRSATTATKASTGFTAATNVGFEVFIYCNPNSATFYWKITKINDGTSASGTATANPPANNTMMCANVSASNAALTTVTAIKLGVSRIYIRDIL